jgi:hypothetical protein
MPPVLRSRTIAKRDASSVLFKRFYQRSRQK